jgi:small toxic polypeptide LdrA/B/C/D
LPLQQGGCMTLAQLGLLLWDDLAAPVIAGILVSIIVSWMDNRK